MSITVSTDLDFLLDDLRLHLGDIDSSSYRYVDEWLRVALVMSLKTLQRWWNFRYTIDESDYSVDRNPNITFEWPEPPVIQHNDERPIVLMASIIIKEGSLQNNSWNVGSWRDAEIAYSNIQGSRDKELSLKKDVDELESLLLPPKKRLAQPLKMDLPGYKDNLRERTTKY